MPIPTSAEAKVSLREISASTVRAVTDLRVAPEQEGYVASNAVSIAQAYFHREEAWFRSIHAEDLLIGFVMLRDATLLTPPPVPAQLSLWRFMIDRRYQGVGFGRKALELVVEHARTRPELPPWKPRMSSALMVLWRSTCLSASGTLAKPSPMARLSSLSSLRSTAMRYIERRALLSEGANRVARSF